MKCSKILGLSEEVEIDANEVGRKRHWILGADKEGFSVGAPVLATRMSWSLTMKRLLSGVMSTYFALFGSRYPFGEMSVIRMNLCDPVSFALAVRP